MDEALAMILQKVIEEEGVLSARNNQGWMCPGKKQWRQFCTNKEREPAGWHCWMLS